MNKHLFSPSTKGTRLLLLGLVLGLGVFLPTFAHAATFNVPDGDVAGLIAAINAANANPDSDNVNLATGGTYTLTAVDNMSYYGPSGLPVIVSPITINGNGATIQRSSALATPDFRIFLVSNGLAQLTLNGLTIKGGQGGGWGGAGILNTGSLLIRNSTVTKNVGVNGDGGGILNYCGTLTITNSTISNNKSLSGYGGGGVLNFSSYCQAITTIVNSTIFENVNTVGRGDAIADAFSAPGSVILKNSIFASPTQGLGSACYAVAWASLGHNIAGDASCGFTSTGDMNSTNPQLGALAHNGGPTQTHAPLLGSPAIDAVPLADCTDTNANPITTDQRGVTRPQGAACDIGSVELVTTPQGRTALIIAQIQALITAGVLTPDQGAGLTDKLNSIISKLNNGQTGPACKQLSAFSAQVQGFVNSGALTPAQGQALIDAAAAVKSQIGC
jgi:hypothetical protein